MNLHWPNGSRRARKLTELSTELALASDQWFLIALDGADRTARWLKTASERYLAQGSARLWTRLVPARSPRDRLLALLQAEARRARYDVSQPSFQLFSERIAVLLELVFSGAIGIDDIAFEAADGGEPAAASSAEIGEEVPDDPDCKQAHEERALRV
jgi:hypothetical protein